MSRAATLLVAMALLTPGGARAAEEGAQPATILLPLLADGGITGKQARGVSAQVRRVVDGGAFIRVLSSSRDDDKQANVCRLDARCLGKLADLRGADLILAGTVSPADDGLRVTLVVVKPGATTVLRREESTLQGNEEDARRLDRIARAALNPRALRGAILVEGDAGADVTIDDSPAGRLPLPEPIGDLVAGPHVVTVTKGGFEVFRRVVQVSHDETTVVKALLLAARAAPSPQDTAVEGAAGSGIGLDVIVASSIGAGLIVLGGVAGALSLRESLAVEERAKAQQLTFPRDSELLLRGEAFAWAANGLSLAGAAALGAAAVLWALHPTRSDDEESTLPVTGALP